ncbi:MAG: hypothetical protein OXC98_00550 [bacterium]|nr:hypothetical protein [Acidimicrobiia bacterium]MCY4648849.1 hypothetical protein [bacterium]
MAKSILIRNVPDEIHLQLKWRAQCKGQPLQQYLLTELTTLAERPTMEEVLERISSRRMERVDMETILADLDEERRDRM